MALTKFTGAINTIQSLSDQPNQTDGITAAQLKLKFDQAAIDSEAYLNDVLTVEIEAGFATKAENTLKANSADVYTKAQIDATQATKAETVKNTGNETIAGVKTFSASPIVPTPTTDKQASPKDYVDGVVTGVVLGQIPDGSITDLKLSNTAGQLKSTVTTHIADKINHVPYGGTTTNVGNAYSLAYAGITALAEGTAVCFKANADSTGATTINVNGLGAKAIKKAYGTDVINIKTGGMYTLRYNGTNFTLQGEGGSGNSVASDLLLGKTASTDVGDIVGTMPNKGATNIQSSLSADVTIPEGYYNGTGNVLIGVFTAGDTTTIYSATGMNNTTTSGSLVNKLEKTVSIGGTFRVKFNLKTEIGAYYAQGRIYRNGIAVGTMRQTTSTTFVEYSEDIAGWSPNDKIQLYMKSENIASFAINSEFSISVNEQPLVY